MSLELALALAAVTVTQSRPQTPLPRFEGGNVMDIQYQPCRNYNPNPPPYSATDGSANTLQNSNPPYFGGFDTDRIQFVPVGAAPGANGRFHVAYSAKQGVTNCTNCPSQTYNVTMTVFELSCLESADVLLFGTGYGCRHQNSPTCCVGAQYSPQHDAGLIDEIIRTCLAISGTVKIDIVVPHSHADHINPETVHALEALGYTIRKIFVHVDDRANLEAINTVNPNTNCTGVDWTQGDLNKMVNFGTDDPQNDCIGSPECEQHWNSAGVKSFSTTVGRVWFQERDGHTAGSVDLVLDYGGNEGERYVIYGSTPPNTSLPGINCHNPSSTCTLTGVVWATDAHGNVILQ
jgi:hypothetical protein